MWLHYYNNVYLIETKEQQSGRLFLIHPPSSRSWPKEEAISCSIDKVSWNGYCYNKINYAGLKYSIWLTDARCLSSVFLYDSLLLLLTVCAGREFQIFTILLTKKCFASFDLKRLPMILKPLLRVVLVRSVVT